MPDYGFRYYIPVSGRWLSRDPIGEEGGVNLFAICGNAALYRSDGLGCEFRLEFGWTDLNRIQSYGYNAYTGPKPLKLGGFGVAEPTVVGKEDNIEESDDQCCAKVKRGKEIDLVILALWPEATSMGKQFTLPGIRDLYAHENKRAALYRDAWDKILEPVQGEGKEATRCPRIYRKALGEARKLLVGRLERLRTQAFAKFHNYASTELGRIGGEVHDRSNYGKRGFVTNPVSANPINPQDRPYEICPAEQ